MVQNVNEREHVQNEHKALESFTKRIIKGTVKFECATCGGFFDSKSEATTHFRSVHEETKEVHEENKRKNECPNCEATFKNTYSFKKHCAKYHGDLISVVNSPKKVKT